MIEIICNTALVVGGTIAILATMYGILHLIMPLVFGINDKVSDAVNGFEEEKDE